MNLKSTLFFLSLQLGMFMTALAQEYSLKSPDGRNQIRVTLDDEINYSILHKGKVILNPSPISLVINGKKLGVKPNLKKEFRTSVKRTIKPVVKVKRAEIEEHYNQLVLKFKNNYSVTFRSYNEGIAYRIETTINGNIEVESEELVYNFPENFRGSFPISDGFFSHQERLSLTYTLDSLPLNEMSCLPILMHLNDGVKAVITEADLYDYPGFYLQKGKENSLKGLFPKYPLKTVQPRDRDVKVTERADFIAKTSGSRKYPWRLMAISDNDGELIENEMVYLLSREQSVGINMDWIKPGKVAWDWYNANNIFGVDFKSGYNTDTYKYYIDFASRFGLEYIIIDEGWYDIKTGDLLKPVSALKIEELINYGKANNVGIILWVTWTALDAQLDNALDKFQDWGIKGVKVDFMQRDDQWMVNYYEKVAEAAAKRKLLVDFHGSYKPSGLRRAYPNVITSEGVVGQEQNKGSQKAGPENNLVIPFTRMLAGPLDYTPGAMVNAQKKNHAPVFERPMSLGTRCHQLAMYVIYESPLQMLADSPSKYIQEPEIMEFLSIVPTVWDDTKVLDAKFGDYALVSRKSGDNWYIGSMTDWDERDLEIDFSFLDDGEYTMVIYQDGINADRYAQDYKKIKTKVSSSDKRKIHLAPGGGWVAILYK